mmetsp:Transcript_1277/g.4253  ORF Transcript_1277/g.4253 Transcript_1277/m.4253 type:complete len:258 (-) Transcript_1277:523-1296(-)
MGCAASPTRVTRDSAARFPFSFLEKTRREWGASGSRSNAGYPATFFATVLFRRAGTGSGHWPHRNTASLSKTFGSPADKSLAVVSCIGKESCHIMAPGGSGWISFSSPNSFSFLNETFSAYSRALPSSNPSPTRHPSPSPLLVNGMAYILVDPSTTWNTLCWHRWWSFPRQIPRTTSTPKYRNGCGSEFVFSVFSVSVFSNFSSPIFCRRTLEKIPSAPTNRSNGPCVVPSSKCRLTPGGFVLPGFGFGFGSEPSPE